jgi:hypothetical protein
MSKTLIKLAQKLAKDQDMIYAPDMEAIIWMQRFSEIVTVQERERCARLAEDWDVPELAAAIRKKDE